MRVSEHRTLNLRTKSGYIQRGYHPSRVSKEPSTVDAGLRAQKLERLLRTKTVGCEQWWSLMGSPPSARQFWAIMIARFRELDVPGTSQYTVLCTMEGLRKALYRGDNSINEYPVQCCS